MNLQLTKEQAQDLSDLLEAALGDLSCEIAATENPQYLHKLRARRDSLAAVAKELRGSQIRGDLLRGDALERELAHPGG